MLQLYTEKIADLAAPQGRWRASAQREAPLRSEGPWISTSRLVWSRSSSAPRSCGWMGARPRTDYTKPRMVPWQILMLTFAAAVMVVGVHLLTLFGVTTPSRQ